MLILGIEMQIIDLDKDPYLSNFTFDKNGQVFAGHFTEIIGLNYDSSIKNLSEHSLSKKEPPYKSKEDIRVALDVGKLKTIWINTKDPLKKNKSFSIMIRDDSVKREFLDKYSDYVGPSNFFIVCDDAFLVSNNRETDYKKFFLIDSIEQLNKEFKIWH